MLRLFIGILQVGLMVGAGAAFGQEYPSKPIRFVTSGAGSGSDFTARLVAQGISGPLGQPVVVDNRPSNFGPDIVAKAPPDGYVLLVSGGAFWTFPFLQKTAYDPVRDFSPITMIETSVSVVAVHPSLPVKSVKELIALAKARPGELNYASTGAGGALHLAAELFKAMAGVDIARISYKSTGQAVNDLVGGHVQLAFSTVPSVAPHVKSGRLRALAVTSAQPSALAPGLPTVAASGVPGYEAVGGTALFAPAKTPATVINRLNQEIVRFVNSAEARDKFFNIGSETVGSSPDQLAQIRKAEMDRLGKLIKDIGLLAD